MNPILIRKKETVFVVCKLYYPFFCLVQLGKRRSNKTLRPLIFPNDYSPVPEEVLQRISCKCAIPRVSKFDTQQKSTQYLLYYLLLF